MFTPTYIFQESDDNAQGLLKNFINHATAVISNNISQDKYLKNFISKWLHQFIKENFRGFL